MKTIYKNNWFWLGIAIVVFLVNQLPYLADVRPVMYDEAWYGNTAYNCAQGNGFLNTAVGSRGNSNFLLPLITAAFLKVFGYNLLSIRLAAVFCGVITLLFISLSFKEMKVSWLAQALAYAFFVSITLYNTIFRFGRPECAALMCLSGGVWMYLRYKSSPTWLHMAGMSIFAYLAACAHPYALLFFALVGAILLIQYMRLKDWKHGLQLALLLIAAIAAIASITWVSNTYNIAEEDYIQTRFSAKDIMLSIPSYFGSAFTSRHTMYVLPLLFVLLVLAIRDDKNREMAVITLVFFLIFPILFSTDLAMVGLGLDYMVLLSTILLAPFIERVVDKKWFVGIYIAYCLCNISMSYYFNYKVKYENVNMQLTKELQAIVPQNSKVIGPLRQWPMLMQTDYQSDHTCFPVHEQEYYDFIILNSQDIAYYPIYPKILPIDTTKMELVYERLTKQYGNIMVYKRKW